MLPMGSREESGGVQRGESCGLPEKGRGAWWSKRRKSDPSCGSAERDEGVTGNAGTRRAGQLGCSSGEAQSKPGQREAALRWFDERDSRVGVESEESGVMSL